MLESSFIEWIRSQSRFDPAAVPVGPGDDMAVVACGGRAMLLTTDSVLDGVHFILAEHGPRAAGRKAMARNLSDVAAMAAVPVAAVAAVALPRGFSRDGAEEIYHGLRAAGDAFGCPLVGGDVASWDGALSICVTILARPGATPPVLRRGAQVGDAVCVTGQFGAAWRTSRHLTFTPRIAEAAALAQRGRLHAMIDVSDGLARDLGHICEASGVGAEVRAADVPIHADARKLAGGEKGSGPFFAPLTGSSRPGTGGGRKRDLTPFPLRPKPSARTKKGPDPFFGLAAALGDGEDYELLFALPAAEAEALVRDQPLGVPVSRIGTIVAGAGVVLVGPGGRREELKGTGWEHAT